MLHVVIELFLWLFGLCVGSFLNVVIYRLDVGLSIARPLWSFCPRCEKPLAWHDNLPVLSWLLLRARCRQCGGPISTQYPLIEAATGLLFVLVYHLLFVAGARAGIEPAILPADVPLLLAWLALVAGMVVCSAMDIVSYSLDIRVTNVVVGLGVVLHACWPRPEILVPAAQTPLAAALVAAFIIGGLAYLFQKMPVPDPPDEEELAEDATTDSSRLDWRIGATAAVVTVIATLLLIAPGVPDVAERLGPLPVLLALLLLFALVVGVGGQQRAADEEIHTVIEDERPQARKQVLREILRLLPALIVAVAVYLAVDQLPAFARGWERIATWSPLDALTPAAGAVYAIKGAVCGAVAGWILRVVFTLIYGREAFGVGDIYILAAGGAVAGWDIVLLGLLVSVAIALVGWILSLMMKSTVMIPFGPWLALGFITALWISVPGERIIRAYARSVGYAWDRRPDLLLAAGGLMLVASTAAIALSRLVRHWVERAEDDLTPDTDQQHEHTG